MLRVVTLPPGLGPAAALELAARARRAGAGALELRSDLHAASLPAEALAAELPLLAAERGSPIPAGWEAHARWIDRPLPAAPGPRTVLSHHADRPLSADEAERLWRGAPLREVAGLKHVEPLGELGSAGRLLETQRRLSALAGPGRVTVLATGACALPFRAVLAEANAFDYLAAGPEWAAAPGQRLLGDAVRAARAAGAGARLGILGADIAHARSPRVHRQPFDRIDLPAHTELGPVLAALWPHYRGLAVTSPFKRAAASAIASPLAAINTLVRRPSGWRGANTDVEGARAALEALGAPAVTVLGDGGVTEALRLAALDLGVGLTVLRRAEAHHPVRGAAVWTWPPQVTPSPWLSLREARVAVVAYGAAGRQVAAAVRALGGVPLELGPRWFIAQARAQRALWEGQST